jgi:hypothetical protein
MQRVTGFYSFRFEDRIPIAAPPEAGFAFFQDMEANYLRWHPDHLGFEWRKGRGIVPGTVIWFQRTHRGQGAGRRRHASPRSSPTASSPSSRSAA